MKKLLPLLVTLLCCASLSAPIAAPPPHESQVIVKWTTPGNIPGGNIVRRFGTGAELWRVPPGIAKRDVVEWLRFLPNVKYAVEDAIVAWPSVLPNDPILNNNLMYGLYWYVNRNLDIAAPEAWNTFHGSPAVHIVDADTGVDPNHPDLAPNLGSGYDYYNNDPFPVDGGFHGTHTAGTICAKGNNGIGVTGVMWDCTLHAVKVCGDGTGCSTSAILSSFDFAYSVGARVVNLSLGGPGDEYIPVYQDAIDLANLRGIMLVIAAGNRGWDMDDGLPNHPKEYPCAMPQNNVICVAMLSTSGLIHPSSEWGHISVDLAALGKLARSTWNDTPIARAYLGTGTASSCESYNFNAGAGCYQGITGTSMATPLVTGCVGLLLQKNPTATITQLRSAILSTTRYNASLDGKVVTNGQLDCDAALTALPAQQGGGPHPPPWRIEE